MSPTPFCVASFWFLTVAALCSGDAELLCQLREQHVQFLQEVQADVACLFTLVETACSLAHDGVFVVTFVFPSTHDRDFLLTKADMIPQFPNWFTGEEDEWRTPQIITATSLTCSNVDFASCGGNGAVIKVWN